MACVNTTKDGIDYLVALTPIVVATFVAWIGFQQFRIGRDKLRLDLYQRRFTVYERTLSLYHYLYGTKEALQSKDFSESLKYFITSYRESQFLFDDEPGVFRLLKEFHTKAAKIIGFKRDGGELLRSDPREYLKLQEDVQNALASTEEMLNELERLIAPYLSFRRALA